MFSLRRTGALVLIALLALGLAPAAAQESTPASVATTAGMQQAVSRQYGADPNAPAASPASHAGDPFVATARVLTYDTEEHATAAYDASIAGAMEQVQSMGVDMDTQVEEADIDDLGDGAHGVTVHSTRDGISGYIRFLFVREEMTVFVVSAIAGSDEGAHITDRLAQAMLAREPGEGEPVFDATGGSKGGLWELFPPEGDPVLEGLVIIQDQQMSQPRA